jgi:predicted ATPase
VSDEKAHWTPTHSWWRLASDPALVADINRWLRDTLKTRYACKMGRLLDETGFERGVFPEFLDVDSNVRLSHRDLGFGVSQMLPVLVESAASSGALVAIEQPELHLHPALQAELGDVFIESALGERKNTFLLETHSEHLILRILRRVRETTEGKMESGKTPVRPEDVTVVFVEPTAKGSVVRHLPVTPDGDFGAPWPGGVFAERFKDLP